MQFDVVVIGAGLAGMCAAGAAADQGAKVALLDKGGIGLGTNSAIAHAFFTTPTPDFSPEDYVREVLETGRGINRAARVRYFAEQVPEALDFARRDMGMNLELRDKGYIVEAERPEVINGVAMMTQAAAAVKAKSRITRISGSQAVSILKHEGRACGVLILGKDGEWRRVTAPVVILASGGFGALYKHNDNVRSTLGQGHYLAAKAGLALWDMEFVQFFPMVMNQPGLPMFIVYPGFMDGARLINEQGEDLLAKYGVPDMLEAIKRLRDKLSAALYGENQKGRVMLDLTRVKGDWSKKPLSLLARLNYDFKNKPFGIMPGAHFTMGGVKVDHQGRSSLPGLLACGEICWGMHGANRRGGNALTECLVSGMLTGRAASREAREAGSGQCAPEEPLPAALDTGAGDLSPARRLIAQLKEAAWLRAGITRSAQGMQEGLSEARTLARQADELPAATVRQYQARENAKAAAFCYAAVLAAGQNRLESRGAFMRTDYPEADDRNWRVNSRLSYDHQEGAFEVEYAPLAAE